MACTQVTHGSPWNLPACSLVSGDKLIAYFLKQQEEQDRRVARAIRIMCGNKSKVGISRRRTERISKREMGRHQPPLLLLTSLSVKRKRKLYNSVALGLLPDFSVSQSLQNFGRLFSLVWPSK